MAERGGGGNDSRGKLKEGAKVEENPSEDTQSKEKGQDAGAITDVKSKIKERNAEQAQPAGEESVAGFKGLKVGANQTSLNKISKLGKQKRVKSKNEIMENQESTLEEANIDNTTLEDFKSESFVNDSEVPSETNTNYSKKSLMQMKSLIKGSKKSISPAEEKRESIQSKQESAIRKASKESASSLISSENAEIKRNPSVVNSPSGLLQDNLNRSPSQRHILERGNYMNNVAAVPPEEPAEEGEVEAEKPKETQGKR